MAQNNDNPVEEKFWTDDFCALFRDPWRIVPLAKYTRNEKLNALTRLSILIALVLLVLGHEYWYIFLGLSVLILILLKYTCSENRVEGFSITPTYANNDLHTTTLAPAFSESHRGVPPSYDLQVNVPFEDPTVRYVQDPLLMGSRLSQPYGEYVTSLNNVLPADAANIRNLCSSGPVTAREYANSAFLRHRLGFQEDMTRIYKVKLSKRFRNNASVGNSFAPFYSF